MVERSKQAVEITFDDAAVDVIERLQDATGRDVAGVLNDAIGFYDWARQHVEAGCEVATVSHATDRVTTSVMPFRRRGG